MDHLIVLGPFQSWTMSPDRPAAEAPLVAGEDYHVSLAIFPPLARPVTATPVKDVGRALFHQYRSRELGFALADLKGRHRWYGTIAEALAGDLEGEPPASPSGPAPRAVASAAKPPGVIPGALIGQTQPSRLGPAAQRMLSPEDRAFMQEVEWERTVEQLKARGITI